METRKDILWRSYLVFIAIMLFGVAIAAKVFYIQRVEGKYWKALSDSLQLKYRSKDAERGTIYSEDGRMLSTSVPNFDVYLDFGSEGIQENNGKNLKKYIDTLAINLAFIFKDNSAEGYKEILMRVFEEKDRYHLLKRNIDFRQYQSLWDTRYLSKNKNKNGFVFVEKQKRIAPFGLLANRTIGLSRSYKDEDGKDVSISVGLERTYDSTLRGFSGKQLVRKISGGGFVPIEGGEIEAENGKDIVTTIDINIQDIAEQALLKMLQEKEAINGTCIVMEVKTGKIKAIANLGRLPNGNYSEDLNHAITRSEPGSTFKLVTMMALLEDQLVNLNEQINLEGGKWNIANQTVNDAEGHVNSIVTIQHAFELSSNVGMAKLITSNYGSNPRKFLDYLKRLHLDSRSGLGLDGESFPRIPDPSQKEWSKTTLAWTSFGYEVAISPLKMLTVYNAIANNGKMMMPYLINSIAKDGVVLEQFNPTVLEESIVSKSTLTQIKACLEGVMERGTGTSLKTPFYRIAGKTGTAKVANGNKGYFPNQHQASFAGYFPADNPKYSCIVVIKNKTGLSNYFGAQVAGPVFREVADKLFKVDPSLYANYKHKNIADSIVSKTSWTGLKTDFVTITGKLKASIKDTGAGGELSMMGVSKNAFVGTSSKTDEGIMPDIKGLGLRDAIELLEKLKLNVVPTGNGKVVVQSIPPGASIVKGQTVYLTMGSKTN